MAEENNKAKKEAKETAQSLETKNDGSVEGASVDKETKDHIVEYCQETRSVFVQTIDEGICS